MRYRRLSPRSPYTTLFRSDAAASRPPCIAERCLRTVFISWIGAPHASSSRVTALRSAIEIPSAGSESSEEPPPRSEEHTSELQSHSDLVCRLLLEKKKKKK